MNNRIAYRNLWIATLADGISCFGDNFQYFAAVGITYAVTGSPLFTALQTAVGFIPHMLLARWAGPLVDRVDGRKVVAVTSIIQALLTVGYMLTRQVEVFFLLHFLVASAGAFGRPARTALFPRLVGYARLLKANGRQTAILSASQLLGPGLAGWAIANTGTQWAFGFNAASFLVPAIAMLLVRPQFGGQTEPQSGGQGNHPSGQFSARQFLRSRPSLLLVLIAYCAYMMGMWALNTLFYPFAIDTVHCGSEAMGWMISAYYGAGLISGFVIERWGHWDRTGN